MRNFSRRSAEGSAITLDGSGSIGAVALCLSSSTVMSTTLSA
jgi:hypothetical protein